jgi:hypothetical protein
MLKLSKWMTVLLVVVALCSTTLVGLAQDEEEIEVPEEVQETLDMLVEEGYLPDETEGELLFEPVTEEVSGAEEMLELEDVEARDFVIQADLSWTSEDRKDQCGLLMRYQDELNFHEFIFERTGVVNFSTSIGSIEALDFWRFGSDFDLEEDGVNRVTIILNANHYTVLINDELLRDYSASRYREPEAGGIALLANGDLTCTFTDLWVWAFEGAEVEEQADVDAGDAGDTGGDAGDTGEDAACAPIVIDALWEVAGGCVTGQALWDRAVYVRVSGGDGESYDYYWGGEMVLEGAGDEVGFQVTGSSDQEAVINTVMVESCGRQVSQELYVTQPEGGDACGD